MTTSLFSLLLLLLSSTVTSRCEYRRGALSLHTSGAGLLQRVPLSVGACLQRAPLRDSSVPSCKTTIGEEAMEEAVEAP